MENVTPIIRITQLVDKSGVPLRKRFTEKNGKLEKISVTHRALYRAAIKEVAGLPGLRDVLASGECTLILSAVDLPAEGIEQRIVSKKFLHDLDSNHDPDQIHRVEAGAFYVRSKKTLQIKPDMFLLCDYDPDPEPPHHCRFESVEDWWRAVCKIMPEFSTLGYVDNRSSSAGIRKAGELVSDSSFTHRYIQAKNVTENGLKDLKRLFMDRAEQAGYTWQKVYNEGNRRKTRKLCPLDLSVLSHERLVYEATPELPEGYTRDDLPPVLVEGGVLDLQSLEPLRRDEARVLAVTRKVDDRIGTLNTSCDLERLLQEYGYIKDGDRWKAPNSTGSPGVIIYQDPDCPRVWSNHQSDVLNVGRPLTYFEAAVILKYDGNIFLALQEETGIAVGQHRLAEPPEMATYPDVKVNDKGEVTDFYATVGNFKHCMEHYKIQIRFNQMSKKEEIIIPDFEYSLEASGDAPAAHIRGVVNRCDFKHMPVDRFIEAVASEPANMYHPVRTWIESQPWDGVSRIGALADCLHTPAKFPADLKLAYLRRFGIGAVAAVYEPEGISSRNIPLLVGPQEIGKTRMMHSLVPENWRGEWTYELEGMNPKNKDDLMNAVSHWITELSEIESHMRRSDQETSKTFLSRNCDQVRTAYSRREKTMPRRTVFWATANTERPLADMTGNTRYLVIPVTLCNFQHDIDIQQLWAEFKSLYQEGEQWWLTPEEARQRNEVNKGFELLHPIEEAIHEVFRTDGDRNGSTPYSAMQVLMELGFQKDRITRIQLNDTAEILKRLGYKRDKLLNGRTVYDMPEKHTDGPSVEEMFGHIRPEEGLWAPKVG